MGKRVYARNKYGLDCKKQPFPQLAQLLGIWGALNVCTEFKLSLRQLAIQYLDLTKTPSEQTKAIDELAEKVIARHPEWFKHHGKTENELRKFVLLRTLAKIHNHRRSHMPHLPYCDPMAAHSKKIGKTSKSTTLIGEATRKKGNPKDIDALNVIDISDSESEIAGSQDQRFITDLYRPSPPSKTSGRNSPPNTLASYFKITTRTPTESTPSDSSSPSQASPLVTKQGWEIGTFLEACQPSMIHFLMHFVEYGCTTDAYLRSLATFSQERRRFVLRKILTCWRQDEGQNGLNGTGCSEMDLDVLENHIDKCYGQNGV